MHVECGQKEYKPFGDSPPLLLGGTGGLPPGPFRVLYFNRAFGIW